MHKRKAFVELQAHLSNKLITVITGMRRVGKSTALKFLLGQITHSNKVYIDFEFIENRIVFNGNSYAQIENYLKTLGLNLSEPAVIALDEIQLVKNSPSVIKYLYDTYSVKFIVTGSSSFYLKNHFTESLAGRKTIFEMYPLDFQEFLDFKEIQAPYFDSFRLQSYAFGFYTKYKALYDEYLRFGSFPQVVLIESEKEKIALLKDIVNAYIELDVRLLSDFSKSDDLYKLIQVMANHVGSKIDYTKIGSLLGINRNKIKDYLYLLEYTYFIHTVPTFSRNTDVEISHQRKVYFADTGVLQLMAQVSSGQVFENSVYLQYKKTGCEISYHQKPNGQEIDFILDNKQSVEVKETPTASDFQTLHRRTSDISLLEYTLIGKTPALSGFENFVWGGNIY